MAKPKVRKAPSPSPAEAGANAVSRSGELGLPADVPAAEASLVPPSGQAQPPSSTPAASHVAAHTEFAAFHESYLRDNLSRADTKATLLFGLTSALLAYLFGHTAFRDMVLHPAWNWQSVAAILSASLLALSTTLSILVIAPRLSSSRDKLVFFGAVARYKSSLEYLAVIKSKDQEELTNERIFHCYDVALICRRKYRTLQRVIWLGFGGIIACLPLVGVI